MRQSDRWGTGVLGEGAAGGDISAIGRAGAGNTSKIARRSDDYILSDDRHRSSELFGGCAEERIGIGELSKLIVPAHRAGENREWADGTVDAESRQVR